MISRTRLALAALALTLVFCSVHTVFAQLPSIRLLTVTPPGGKAGSTFEASVTGQALDDTNELRFSHSGIAATAKGTNRFEVIIAKEVPPGIYDVRAVGKHGGSNPRAFAVGVLTEITESKNTSDAPQTVPLESTINGRTEANTVDYFRFEAKKGQRVLVRCDTREIDSKLEPILALYDSTGHEVIRSRSSGLLDHAVREDGEFIVRLHDLTYRGGTEFFYRLSVGTFPHIDYVLPIERRTKTKFAVFGRNLPGGKIADVHAQPGLERMEVELGEDDPALARPLTTMPAQAGLNLFEHRIRNERGVSEAALIRFPTALIHDEQETNNTRAAAQKITVPCEVAGRFFPNGDRDWFSFAARKGDVYWIEVVSHRLGLPTDPFVLVQRATTNGATDALDLNDSEANAGGAEFNTMHRDPSGKFEAKEDGTYYVQVRDLFSQPKPNPALVYHLIIRKPAPDFQLVALATAPAPTKKDAKDIGLTTTALRRGETLPIKVIAWRHDGFEGEIDVTTRGLPPAVAAAPCRIESGKNSALLFLTAMDDATASNGAVTVRGTAAINGTNVTRQAAAASVIWGTADPAIDAVMTRVTANGALSVAEEAVPVWVHAASNVIETVVGKTAKINFLLERRESFSGAVKLKPFGLAALDSVPELDVDAKATNLVLQIDLKEKKVLAGTHVFALQVSPQAKAASDSSKKPKDAPSAFYSEPVVLRVKPAPAPSTNSPAK